MHRWMKSRGLIVVTSLLCALFAFNCGNGDELETVHLYVFNAYPGSSNLSLYGSSGAIATDLGYGERTDEPVEVNRNLGGEFTLILDGAPEIFDGTEDLFSLYPQETGTFVISQRRDTTVNTQVLRHTSTIARGCRLAVLNALTLSSSPLHEYSFFFGWRFNNPADAGYDSNREGSNARSNMYTDINNNPYFVLASAEPESDDEEESDLEQEATRALEFVWVGPEDRVDLPNVDARSGSITTFPPTDEYMECIETGGENCNAPRNYSATTHSPDAGVISEFLHYNPESIGNPAGDCSTEWRIYSDFANIYEFDEGGEPVNVDFPGPDQEFSFEAGNYLYFILHGRPINPSIEAWVTGQQDFGDFTDFPDN